MRAANWALVALAAAFCGPAPPREPGGDSAAGPAANPAAPDASDANPEAARRGPVLVYRLDPLEAGGTVSADDAARARERITERFRLAGAAADVSASGDDGLTVALHHADESADEARALVEAVGAFEMRLCVPEPAGDDGSDAARPPGSRRLPMAPDLGGLRPAAATMLVEFPEDLPPGPDRDARMVDRVYTDRDLAAADATEQSGRFLVAFEIVEERKDDFREFTARSVGSALAIVVDGTVHSAPVIRTVLPGRGVIDGGPTGFSPAEASRFAATLGAGRLPCRPVHVRTDQPPR